MRSKSFPFLALALGAAAFLIHRSAHAQEERRPSRFYWHEAVGFGVLTATSNYDTGTRDFTAPAINLVSTFAARVAPGVAVGGAIDFYFLPPFNVNEDRSLGHKDLAAPFGIAGVFGPSLALLPGSLRFDITPGVLWVVGAPADNGGAGGSIGGVGFGGTVAAAYDFAIGTRVMLGFELRGLAGAYGNGDPTHTGGSTFGATGLIALRAR